MTEKDLIKQLKELKEIKPRKDWVLLTKDQILANEESKSILPFFQWKLAFAPVISVLIIIGLFGFANNTVPGDFLFSVKKAAESAQVGFSSAAEKPGIRLELANRRLEELSEIAKTNRVRNISPAIKEFQDNVAEAVNGLALINVTGSNLEELENLLAETQKIEKNKQALETVLGTQIGDTEELGNAISRLEKQTAGYLIADWEKITLSQEGQKLLAEAKEAFEAGDYSLALEKLWFLSNK